MVWATAAKVSMRFAAVSERFSRRDLAIAPPICSPMKLTSATSSGECACASRWCTLITPIRSPLLISGTERKASKVSSGSVWMVLKRASAEALFDSATTDLCCATQPVMPSPIFRRMLPISEACGSCEACSTTSLLARSTR